MGNSRWSRSASTLLERADLVSDNEIRRVPGVCICAALAVPVMGCGTACRDTLGDLLFLMQDVTESAANLCSNGL